MTHNVSLGNEAVMTHLWLYGLLVLMGVVIVCLLYKLHELRSKGVKERDYHRFLFDILDNLPFPVMVKDIKMDSNMLIGTKNPSYSRALSVKMLSDVVIMTSTARSGDGITGLLMKIWSK